MVQSVKVLANQMPGVDPNVSLAFVHFHGEIQRLLSFMHFLADQIPDGEAPVKLAPHIPLVFELAFCRSIDIFLMYVSELLTSVFEYQPKMLMSSEKVTLEEVLSYSTREELLSAMIEKKVQGLSFKGMKDLHEDLHIKIGFDLFPNQEHLRRSMVLIEKRNLTIHNRGIVNRRYLERVTASSLKLGDRLDFPVEQVVDDLAFLSSAVLDIDTRAGKKFKLDG
jgi:hypothetical protein